MYEGHSESNANPFSVLNCSSVRLDKNEISLIKTPKGTDKQPSQCHVFYGESPI